MVPRDTRTGGVLENTLLPSLQNNGYKTESQADVGQKPNGRKHKIDILVETPGHEKVLVSVKWQQSGGTAEEKIPFEVIKLLYSIEESAGKYNRAYIVLGGKQGWTLKDWYIKGGLNDYIKNAEDIKIVGLEDFITLCNNKKL